MFDRLKMHVRNYLAGAMRNTTNEDRLICYINEYNTYDGDPIDRFGAVYLSPEMAALSIPPDEQHTTTTHKLVELKPGEIIIKQPSTINQPSQEWPENKEPPYVVGIDQDGNFCKTPVVNF